MSRNWLVGLALVAAFVVFVRAGLAIWKWVDSSENDNGEDNDDDGSSGDTKGNQGSGSSGDGKGNQSSGSGSNQSSGSSGGTPDTSGQDPTQSNDQNVEDLCTSYGSDNTNPFCNKVYAYSFDLGPAGTKYGNVEMVVAIDGRGLSSLDQGVKVYLWFADDMRGEFIPTSINGQEHEMTYLQTSKSIKIKIPLQPYWILFEGDGSNADPGYISEGLQMHGFSVMDDAEGTEQLRENLVLRIYPEQNMRMEWERPVETDYVVEREKEAYNDQIKSLLARSNGGLEIRSHDHHHKWGGTDFATRIMPNNWTFKYDSDGYINIRTSHSNAVSYGNKERMRKVSTYWWPRGFKLGGRNPDNDAGGCEGRMFEIRKGGIFKAENCNGGVFEALLSTQRGIHGGHGVNPYHLNGSGRKIDNTWFKQSHISKQNNDIKGIWSSGNKSPENIYLAFDETDPDFWADKYPVKPDRVDRTAEGPELLSESEAADYVL